MNNLPKLIISEEFRDLIRPLKHSEFLQLEENICKDGCLQPIVIWNGTIVDGHNRYAICLKHNIPFTTKNMTFSCKDEVIAWICKNQLVRRNISEETRHYLIGRQYESEKNILRIKNPNGYNQYTDPNCTKKHTPIKYRVSQSRHTTAQRIADENHVTHGTVQKYAIFTKALDEISKKEPELTRKILSGKYKISHKNIMALSELSADELRKINKRVEKNNLPYMRYSSTRRAIENKPDETKPVKLLRTPSIKDMPEYDPDSTIVELSLTIPSWISSIKRMENNTNLDNVSDTAIGELENALLDLHSIIELILKKLREN